MNLEVFMLKVILSLTRDSLQATVAACDGVAERKRHGESHRTQALPGGKTKKRGETPCRDTDTMEDQIF